MLHCCSFQLYKQIIKLISKLALQCPYKQAIVVKFLIEELNFPFLKVVVFFLLVGQKVKRILFHVRDSLQDRGWLFSSTVAAFIWMVDEPE